MMTQPQSTPNGAIYIPAKAFNPYQQWQDYHPSEAERDLGYAASIGLDALRVWLSYEWWEQQPNRLAADFEHFLGAAAARGIRIMPSFFDSCGIENSPAALANRDPATAACVVSPSWAVHRDPKLWAGPEGFVRWFMERFRDDTRLLAIEIINEPYLVDGRMRFARHCFARAAEMRGTVPLTVGAAGIEDNLFFIEYGLDILQFHRNFPADVAEFRRLLERGRMTGETLGKPIWLTEWQRHRPSGEVPPDDLPEDQRHPAYATLAETVRASGLGHFWWSLMLKPAYLVVQRRVGVFNGLFHEDGAVFSLADARALSGNPNFQAEERAEPPALLRAYAGGRA